MFKCHPKDSAHLYDYEVSVDDELICHLCFQPFVDPVDSKCGCTFCSICLQNYLLRFKYCPIDNQKIDWKYCHKASQALRRFLKYLINNKNICLFYVIEFLKNCQLCVPTLITVKKYCQDTSYRIIS